MVNNKNRNLAAISLALALLFPFAALAASTPVVKGSLVPKAVSFIKTLAKGDFKAAETNFTGQMKEAAPPAKLGEIWQGLISQVGAFQGTGESNSVVQHGFTTIVVKTNFKSRTLGIGVTFDSAHRIAGMHFFPPP